MPAPTDEAFEEDRPRPRRARMNEEDRPRRRPRADDEDDEPERARRRRRDEDDDAVAVLIPYKNGKALAAYYCGVFALIPCVGLILGPIALSFGILGGRFARTHPKAHGTGHAVAGIVLGSVVLFLHLAAIAVFVVAAASHRR